MVRGRVDDAVTGGRPVAGRTRKTTRWLQLELGDGIRVTVPSETLRGPAEGAD
jgi:hypothetical protein